MVKNEDSSLLNKRISNSDMKDFCQILEDKQVAYTCEIVIKDGPRYTYKFNRVKREENPFKIDYFKNLQVESISLKSKFCKLKYGEKCENEIVFEGDENDVDYQYFHTKIDVWISNLKRLNRIKVSSSSDYVLAIFYSCIFVVGLTIGYGFLSNLLSRSLLATVITSIVLGLGLLVALTLYFIGFVPYELDIGLCEQKTVQKTSYAVLSLCVVPIILGLVI